MAKGGEGTAQGKNSRFPDGQAVVSVNPDCYPFPKEGLLEIIAVRVHRAGGMIQGSTE